MPKERNLVSRMTEHRPTIADEIERYLLTAKPICVTLPGPAISCSAQNAPMKTFAVRSLAR
jgi:hypothetical protein